MSTAHRLDAWSDETLLCEQAAGLAGPTFATFYARHERGVLAYFGRRVATPELAADLAAETFAQALASRHRFRARGEGSSAAWLYGIARNVLARSLRRGRVEDRMRLRLGLPRLELDDDAIALVAGLGTPDGAEAALERLPAEHRAAVWARIVDERRYPEIATELRCSEAVVRKRVSRGLAAIRRDLEESA
ncbi:MAG: RNA polymerase sigma factor [Solirubrobacteraceae bacterium]|nr:RNA polymerase sigma factor [Solirubrobacteraceae bacterium]